MGRHCCIKSCRNTRLNSNYKFYMFPKAQHKLIQRKKWIEAVRRINPNGSEWKPAPFSTICSAHFINNKKSEAILSPSYVPTLFLGNDRDTQSGNTIEKNDHPTEQMNEQTERKGDLNFVVLKEEVTVPMDLDNNFSTSVNNSTTEQSHSIKKETNDQSCQAHIFSNEFKPERTMICNRYIYNNAYSDVEIQTTIVENVTVIRIPNPQKYKDKACNTPTKKFADQGVGPIIEPRNWIPNIETTKNKNFVGFKSIKDDNDLQNLAGVTIDNFNLLLKRLKNTSDTVRFSDDKLFLFLTKIKTGLTSISLGVLFSLNRTSIARIFSSILEELVSVTKDLVYWPPKDIVNKTMPKFFKPKYSNTRVILSYMEINIESASNPVNSRKNKVIAKLIMGTTPSGFINFISKVDSERKSNSQIAIEAGLIDLLENDDIIMADESFREIQLAIDKVDKNIKLVTIPYSEKPHYKYCKFRDHIERMTERLRNYQILNKFTDNLLSNLDDVIHVCCVLTNFQVLKNLDDKKDHKNSNEKK